MMMPLFKAMVQIIFCNTKWVPFEHRFDLWKKKEVSGRSRQIKGVSKHSNVFTG
jgi:hypothetical protein